MLSIGKKKFGLQCPRRKNGQIFVFRIIVAAFFQTRKHQAFCKSKQSNNKSYVMRCAIWYDFYNLKDLKDTLGGVFILTKINTPPWVFFTFF